ncbi:MAG: zinc ribbon domain-containing protein [Candidatus Margulisbacteria bacterium]|nr:zinc ribbon domain-containing protein [Candidatus Margulisiibacteriota bacterium]
MPVYEYKCTKCKYVFEVKQSINDEPIKTCPKCKGAVNKIFSAAGIVLKGSGFHNTDYGKYQHKDKEKPKKETQNKAQGKKLTSPPPISSD